MKIIWILLFLFASLSGQTLSLREAMGQAKQGDYVAYVRNKNYTLLVVRTATPNELTLEEITIPEALLPPDFRSWRSWLEGGAPCHTARVTYGVNLETGKLSQYYSHTQGSYMDVDGADNLFTKLLNLQFSPVSSTERKSLCASDGTRKPWNPKMVIDGRHLPGIEFDAWQTRWPSDGSELAGKVVQVYLPQTNPQYPGYFPYWITISAAAGKAHLRVVDSGRVINN